MTMRFISGSEARGHAWANVASGTECQSTHEMDLVYAMIRLAATRVGPSTRGLLAAAVGSALRGLVQDEVRAAARVDGAIDELIMAGDLMVAADEDGTGRRLIFVGPPMYVRRASGAVFIMGGATDTGLGPLTRCRGAVRELEPPPPDDVLADQGFTPYPADAWIESPPGRDAKRLIGDLDRLLDAAPPSGEVPEAEIVDPDARPDYYRGRWVPPRRQTGRYITRRKLRWGGHGWGYADLVDGLVTRYIAFPALDRRFRPCDEAWWVLCAADSLRGSPQSLLVAERDADVRIAVQMPVPMWAERRLLTLGSLSRETPLGAILAYDVPAEEAPEEIAFLTERLWLRVRRESA